MSYRNFLDILLVRSEKPGTYSWQPTHVLCELANSFHKYYTIFNANDFNADTLPMQGDRACNRLFYLSIPPNIFVDAVRCATLSASSVHGWTRVIVEKPFGRDSESSAALTNALKLYLEENQIFR